VAQLVARTAGGREAAGSSPVTPTSKKDLLWRRSFLCCLQAFRSAIVVAMMLAPLDQRDPRLRQPCAEISKAALRERQQQLEIDALLDFVLGSVNKSMPGTRRDPRRPNTVGLAGNQVGIMKQICIVDLSIGRTGYSDLYILINPKITWRSKGRVTKPEGCVNFPEIWGETVRSRAIRVQALDRSGNELVLRLTGWPAVLLQHEVDHLNGHLFIDRLTDPRRAHLVTAENYSKYRRSRRSWSELVDISSEVVVPSDERPV
jgi:peptide deformylase